MSLRYGETLSTACQNAKWFKHTAVVDCILLVLFLLCFEWSKLKTSFHGRVADPAGEIVELEHGNTC